jgi:hypothetical protein
MTPSSDRNVFTVKRIVCPLCAEQSVTLAAWISPVMNSF